jgi:diadenosine tetraphosphate (Ap4A) HIT family hydrolase
MMGIFEPPKRLMILQTGHWVLGHLVDSALPGYLMLGARMPSNDLSLMPAEALAELGALLARAQNALNAILEPSICISALRSHGRACPAFL